MVRKLIMKLEQKSLLAHDEQYRTIANKAWLDNLYKENDKQSLLQKMGFEDVFKKYQNKIHVYIDLGCGGGYLLNRASTYFNEVIGIEPSKAALDSAKEINGDISNISYINEPMIEGMQLVSKEQPYLITTSAVLSHITDEHVIEFLNYLNLYSPVGSAIYFYEPFGKNIQTNLWHVRSKKWWIKNLQGWSVSFGSIKDSGYIKGIYAAKVCKQNQDEHNVPGSLFYIIEDLIWAMGGYFHRLKFSLKRFISKLLR